VIPVSETFDSYRTNYERVVQDSISFSGLKHDFFLEAKIHQLTAVFQQHFGSYRPTLLDIGCGVGRMHPLLLSHVTSLAGADVSTESLARAQSDNPDVEYRADEGAGLPWVSNAFDATLAVCVLHHVEVGARENFIADMVRVTRPGGLVLIIEHNPYNPLTRLAVARCPFDADAVLLKNGEAKARLSNAGLSAVTCQHFLIAPTLAAPVRRLERALAGLPLGAQYIATGVVS
jgi:SAM-dependent methyltransferase